MPYDTLSAVEADFRGFLDSIGCPAGDLHDQSAEIEGEGEMTPEEWEEHVVAAKFASFQKMQREAGIPKRYRFARLAACPAKVRDYAFETRRLIAEDKGCRWLMLAGGPGTGKSYSSAAIASDLIDLGVLYTTFSTVLSDIRDTFNNRAGAASEHAIVEKLCSVPVLVINDFGKDSIGSQWALSKVFQILNERYEEMMATVISTQLSNSELYSYLDIDGSGAFADAMLSRLREAVMLNTNGNDRRGRGWSPSEVPQVGHEVGSDELALYDSRYAQILAEGLSGADRHLKAFGWRAAGAPDRAEDDMRC